MADPLRQILRNKKIRGMLCSCGLKHSAKFSWEKAAKEAIKVYEEAFSMVKEAADSADGGNRQRG